MSYLRAEEILPKELIETIQQYVSGQNIYIPSREKKEWGSVSDTRKLLIERNRSIYEKYRQGVPAEELCREYSLSVKSIQRIVRSVRLCDESGQK